MTQHEQQPDDARFDRLVDGELSQAEYQQLLAALDDEPGGWRRCALSFLEAQALEQELGALRREQLEPAVALPSSSTKTASRRVGSPLMALAMAASFLVAFGLGLAIRADRSPDAAAPQVAENDSQPSPVAIARSTDRGAESGRLRSPLAGGEPQNVTLVFDGQEPAHEQRVEVPLYNVDQVGQDYFTTDQSALSPQMRELLERSGHEIRRHRQLVPLRLENGQRAVFPMEEVEIVPVRMPAF